MQIDHIALWTNDLERLLSFYSNYFHCKVSELYENKNKQFSSYFLSFEDGPRIEIMKRSDISENLDKEKIGLAHFAIEIGSIEKVDRITQKLEISGVHIESFPRHTGDGCLRKRYS